MFGGRGGVRRVGGTQVELFADGQRTVAAWIARTRAFAGHGGVAVCRWRRGGVLRYALAGGMGARSWGGAVVQQAGYAVGIAVCASASQHK